MPPLAVAAFAQAAPVRSNEGGTADERPWQFQDMHQAQDQRFHRQWFDHDLIDSGIRAAATRARSGVSAISTTDRRL